MIRDFGPAARRLLAGRGDAASAAELAAHAAHVFEEVATHFARLLGESGVRLLLKRSVLEARARFPWLAGVSTADRTSTSLRDALAEQTAEAINEAFVAILSTFVALLERLIGEGLVERLLDEMWPGAFTHGTKDPL